jgi:hypothetical protein
MSNNVKRSTNLQAIQSPNQQNNPNQAQKKINKIKIADMHRHHFIKNQFDFKHHLTPFITTFHHKTPLNTSTCKQTKL